MLTTHNGIINKLYNEDTERKLGIFLLFLLAWGNSFWGAWQYDDHVVRELLEDYKVSDFFDGWIPIYANRGLALLTFMATIVSDRENIDGEIINESLLFCHLANLFLHIACLWLVYKIVYRLCGNYDVALCTVLLAGLVPTQAYAVTYITQRMEILGALSVLGCFFYYLQGRYVLSCLFFFGGCFCKETAFIAPFVILAYMGLVEKRLNKWYLVFLFGLSILVYSTYWWQNPQVRYVGGEIPSGSEFVSHGDYGLLVAMDTVVKYTKLLCLPLPGLLMLDYDYTFSTFGPVLFVGLCGLVCYLAVKSSNPRLILFLFVFYLLGFLVISLGLGAVRDTFVVYRAYLPSFAFFALVSMGLYRLFHYRTPYVVATICIIFSACTFKVNTTFYSELALWKDNYDKAPRIVRVVFNYATLLAQEEEKEDKEFYEYLLTKGKHIGDYGAIRTGNAMADTTDQINIGGLEKEWDRLLEKREVQHKKVKSLYLDVITETCRREFPTEIEMSCMAKAFNNLGVIYYRDRDYDKALIYLNKVAFRPESQKNLRLVQKAIMEKQQ